MRIAGASNRADMLIVKWAFSHDKIGGQLATDRNSRLIAEWRTGEVPMNKKAKTKAQKADEDTNLDEALDESFPASDPPSITQPRTGADVRQTKPKRRPKGEAIHRASRQ
jgi:hypothetical protein